MGAATVQQQTDQQQKWQRDTNSDAETTTEAAAEVTQWQQQKWQRVTNSDAETGIDFEGPNDNFNKGGTSRLQVSWAGNFPKTSP